MNASPWYGQWVPIGLTGVLLGILVVLLWGEIFVLNNLTVEHISTEIRWTDILVGLTIYLKTSIDFALFMGNLMRSNPGWINRIAIEIGTAVGNALGTFVILAIWAFFKEIYILLAAMIFIASLVLFQLAEDGFEHAKEYTGRKEKDFLKLVTWMERFVSRMNSIYSPLLSKLIPHLSMNTPPATSFFALFCFSFTIPFILGLDDFAGYVPLFSVINVFGFAIGVMLGHTILNVFLFLSPKKTIHAVKNPLISFIGSLVFIGLGIWGISEAVHLLFGH